MSNYWIELAITNDRQDLADRVTEMGKEIQAILSPKQSKPKPGMLECWKKNVDENEDTITFVEFKNLDQWYLRTFGRDAEIASQLTEIPYNEDTDPISLTLLKTDTQLSFLAATLKEKGLKLAIVPFAKPRNKEAKTIENELKTFLQNEGMNGIRWVNEDGAVSHEITALPKDWCDRINELDDADLVKLFEESFGARVSDLVGLRVEWKAFVHLSDAEFDDIQDCWNEFAESDRAADWAFTEIGRMEEEEQDEDDDEF